jgi:hypothetical protein
MKISHKVKQRIDEILSDSARVPRSLSKRTRYFIDNEFLEHGYAAAFAKSVTLVYNALARYANQNTQLCFPSIETLMKLSGVRNRNSVQKATTILESMDIILVYRSRGRLPNIYSLQDTSKWRPIVDGITPDTVLNKLSVSKRASKHYQNTKQNDITGDTRSLINKSNKEINVDSNNLDAIKKLKELLIDRYSFPINGAQSHGEAFNGKIYGPEADSLPPSVAP